MDLKILKLQIESYSIMQLKISPLPPSLGKSRKVGATGENRTRVTSLEGWGTAIMPRSLIYQQGGNISAYGKFSNLKLKKI